MQKLPLLTASIAALAALLTVSCTDEPRDTGASEEPAQSSSEQSPASTEVWPGEEWQRSTLEAEGLPREPVEAFAQKMANGDYGLVDHILVVRHGKIVFEQRFSQDYEAVQASVKPEEVVGISPKGSMYDYDEVSWHPYYRDTDLHSLQSVTKSVTASIFGTAVDRGLIPSLDAPAMDYFGDYTFDETDPRRGRMTLQDLLTMRSGIRWNTEGGYVGTEHSTAALEASDAWIQYVLSQPMDAEPGTVYEYNDGVSVLIGKVLREATGQRIDAWAEEHFFGPIGIDEYYWKITPDGEADTEGGLYLAAHDLARIGVLFARGGRWQDQQVLSAEWIKAATTPHVQQTGRGESWNGDPAKPVGYGYQWWLPDHDGRESRVYACSGFGGQHLFVVPDQDVVVVLNGWQIRGGYPRSLTGILQDVLPAFRADAR